LSWKRVRYATIMVAVHLAAGGCSSQAPQSDAPAPAPATETAIPAPGPSQREQGRLVLAFGDSLYAGYGLERGQSFPAQLEKTLRQQGIAATVHNAGVSGETSAAGRQRLAFTLDGLPRTPDLAIVGLGGNDMLRGLDPAATRANLLAICEELRKRGIEVVLTGMIAAPNLGQDYGRRFNAIFADVAGACGATLYPFFLEDVITDKSLMLADGIHPNAPGIARIVTRIGPLVARQLRDDAVAARPAARRA
jgi:acyl-CoA thioesterase-1